MNITELADRYVGLWNEPDADRRRATIADLWVEGGVQMLQPPEEIREIAARPGIGLTARLEARGHDALEARALSAYAEFVGTGGFKFRRRDDVDAIDNLVKFTWEMVSPTGEVAGVGLEILLLGADGRIEFDYQFIVS
ncbi:MAG TPA: hypothetical protein VGH14_07895 [Solirubrobacterales bacterium]|jgi:hypothetical protein